MEAWNVTLLVDLGGDEGGVFQREAGVIMR